MNSFGLHYAFIVCSLSLSDAARSEDCILGEVGAISEVCILSAFLLLVLLMTV
jgi:hypothetical protein